MATNLKKLEEQVMRRLSSGDPAAGSKVHPLEVRQAIMQAINALLRPQYFTTLQAGENIPEGCVLCTYENVPVQRWAGVSKAVLPAIPVALPRNIGVFRIGPDFAALATPAPTQLAAPVVTATATGAATATLTWPAVAGATTYVVRRNTTNSQSGAVTVAAGSSRNISDTNLTPDTTYYYFVIARASGYIDSPAGAASLTTQSDAPFAPTDLADLWGWWDAGVGVTGSASVTAWADQSGGGNDLMLVSGAAPLELVANAQNGRPAIKSKNTAGTYGVFTTSVNLPPLTEGTIYLIARQSAADAALNNGYTRFVLSSNNIEIARDEFFGAGKIYVRATPASDDVQATLTDDVFYTIRVRVSGSNVFLSVNNGAEASGTITGTAQAAPLMLFGTGDKQIAEMIVCTTSHDATQRGQVETYLKDKHAHY